MIEFDFLLAFYWLSSEENELADHLSHGRIAEFMLAAAFSSFFAKGVTLVARADAGRTKS